jgi:hypothetical protein
MLDRPLRVQRTNSALDCSRPATALFWGVMGAALALAACLAQGSPNSASLLRVGSNNPLRVQIERELGPLAVTDPTGHDGQLYYLVARDPFATGATVSALIAFDTPRYRYRRILLPLLAGGFGQFSPRATLFGMILCTVIGMALTVIAIADLAYQFDAPGGSVFLGALNLGAIVSVMLVTVDVLALGLSLIAVALLVRQRFSWAVLAFALATLTKETYLLVPIGLAGWQWRQQRIVRTAVLLFAPALPLVAWSIWLTFVIPGIPEPALLSRPMVGVISSLTSWIKGGRLDPIQGAFALYTAVSFMLAFVMLFAGRSTTLKWAAAPWLVLACFTGPGVWGIPSNIGRAFSILWPLGILLLFAGRASARSASGRSGEELNG